MLSGSKVTTFQPATHHQSSPQTNMALNVLEYTFKSHPLTGDEVIMDAWCRTGKLATELSQRLHGRGRVIAYDDNAEMLGFANAKRKPTHKVTFIQRDFSDAATEFEDEADIVISAWHLPFVAADKQPAYLRSLHHRVKPGGLLIIMCPEAHPDLTQAIDAVTFSAAWSDKFASKHIQANMINELALNELIQLAKIEIAETDARPLRHQFNSKQDLANFIAGMLANHLTHLTEESAQQAFINEVTDTYLKAVKHTEKRIPYQVTVRTMIASQPKLENINALSSPSMQKYL